MAKRKYEVSATDEEGDIWTFSSDDRERAERMLEDMRTDFGEAELAER
jgi:hypothetical protein